MQSWQSADVLYIHRCSMRNTLSSSSSRPCSAVRLVPCAGFARLESCSAGLSSGALRVTALPADAVAAPPADAAAALTAGFLLGGTVAVSPADRFSVLAAALPAAVAAAPPAGLVPLEVAGPPADLLLSLPCPVAGPSADSASLSFWLLLLSRQLSAFHTVHGILWGAALGSQSRMNILHIQVMLHGEFVCPD